MSDSEDDNVEFKAHVPAWLRNGIKTFLIPALIGFFAGNGTAGAALYHGVSKDDVISATRDAVTEAIKPLSERLDQIERRQTDVESRDALYRSRMAEIERKLPTRNR